MLVIADGAAFGPYMEMLTDYQLKYGNSLTLYVPESFEWLLLKSGVVTDKESIKILEHPETYIDSSKYMSWEQFFTELLENSTKEEIAKHYQKSKLPPYYISDSIRAKVLQILPDELRHILEIKND